MAAVDNKQKIIKARITKFPEDMFGPCPEVWVTLEDGTEHKLFSYFHQEISFSPSEFIGLTMQQGHELFHKKDVAYLRS